MKYTFRDYKPSEVISGHLKMGGTDPSGKKTDVTSLYFTRGGKPWIGVMGEYHFSRAKKEDWQRELCKMKAGGIDIVATYLFWIYHEEIEGKMDFSGDLDIRAFVLEAKKAGLDVVIRIGPWAHGECRNGGFPDWLLNKPYRLRSNDTEYMAQVRIWYTAIYNEVKDLFYRDGGPIIGIQFENEYVNDASHLLALKELALDIGYEAPIYTVTGWNSRYGAKIPVDDVVPVFSGYVDAPWAGHTGKLAPSAHFVFDPNRNDSAVGVDVIKDHAPDGWRLPYERYPFATCELGAGLQPTHHRRVVVDGKEVYALSLVKLGCGNNLIGYYMYHGGTNKIGKLSSFNETKATKYPNDYPILNYDFHTALSEYGEVREQYRLITLLHLFAHDFGETIAPMEYVGSEKEVAADDMESLRYCMRTDGVGGFVFVNNYCRLYPLSDKKDVEIEIEMESAKTGVHFPKFDVCGERSFFFPFNMKLGDKTLEYATAQPICKEGDTYFFLAVDGIDTVYKFADGDEIKVTEADRVTCCNGIKLVTLPLDEAKYLRRLSDGIYIGKNADLYEYDGEVCAVTDGDFEYFKWNGESFEYGKRVRAFSCAWLTVSETEEPFPPKYTEEPAYFDELNVGGKRKITWKKISVTSSEGFVEINEVYDAAQIYADGELVADEFWIGEPWKIPAKLLYGKECYLAMSEQKDDFYRER